MKAPKEVSELVRGAYRPAMSVRAFDRGGDETISDPNPDDSSSENARISGNLAATAFGSSGHAAHARHGTVGFGSWRTYGAAVAPELRSTLLACGVACPWGILPYFVG
jgi:hypothetical protein